MSTDRDVTRIVRSWLQTDEHESADRVLGVVLDRLDTTPQRRPPWRAWRTRLVNSGLKFAAAGAVALVVAVVGLALYFSRPAVVPAGSPTPLQSPASVVATPTPTQTAPSDPTLAPTDVPVVTPSANQPATGDKAQWIIFHRRFGPPSGGSTEIWAMRADGTGAHRLDLPSGMTEFAWSKDGIRLLAASAAPGVNVFVAEVDDEIGPFVETGFETESDTACIEKSREPFPCQDAAFDFAPDGERVVFVQRCTYELPGCYFLTILNLMTGERTEIYQSPRHRGGLTIELPAWSPDGTQIAFGQAREGDTLHTDLWVVNADGTNLRQIALGDDISHVQEPRWSPDGSRIAFTTFSETEQMVYAINSDPASMGGAAVSSFTFATDADSRACCAEWINNTQLRIWRTDVADLGEEYPFYVMDDHSGTSALLLSLDDALAAIEPPGAVTNRGVPGDPGRTFLWQPAPRP